MGRPTDRRFHATLHLLLVLAVMLQGFSAAAMATTMARFAVESAQGAPSERDGAAPAATPSCHGVVHTPPHPSEEPRAGCCDAAGGLCEWACQVTAPLAFAGPNAHHRLEPGRPDREAGSDAPHWHSAVPLRPPIA